MEQIIEGTIISKELGTFGKDALLYGYLGIRTSDGKKVNVKVDSYTWYDTLEMGSDVIIEAEHLGTTNIIVARKINAKSDTVGQQEHHASVGT